MVADRGHIDPRSEQLSEEIKEVYAWFGLAMYRAQCLEEQLVIILATKYGPDPTTLSVAEYDNIFERLSSRTLGKLVREIGTVAQLGKDEDEQLRRALSKRNWLTHHYFRERSIEFLTESGRVEMIEELQEATDSFQALDEIFTRRTMESLGAFGITQQKVDEELERLRTHSFSQES